MGWPTRSNRARCYACGAAFGQVMTGIISSGFCRGLLRTGVDWFAEARALVIQALQPAGSWGFSAPAPRWKGSLSSPSGFRTL